MSLVGRLAILVHHSVRVTFGAADFLMVYGVGEESSFFDELRADNRNYRDTSRRAFAESVGTGNYRVYLDIVRKQSEHH